MPSTCAQCSNPLPANSIRKNGKDFCSPACVSKFDWGDQPGGKSVCEFC